MNAHVFHSRAEIESFVAGLRAKGERLALVPTMGALHAGHLALVKLARKHADRVAVSIFVNPTQFAPNEDFDRYPRMLDEDVAALGRAGADLIYAPSVQEMYPDGVKQDVVPQGPPAEDLEAKMRPHHFGGVATVVTRLFDHVKPDVAIFGEKDWQQLQVIRHFVAPKAGVEIVAGPTMREKDGLAMSSRNRYLSPGDRDAADTLFRVLTESAARIAAGEFIETVMDDARSEIEMAGFRVDYVEARHAETLQPVAMADEGPVRLLAAARIGGTRLIDNVGVPAP